MRSMTPGPSRSSCEWPFTLPAFYAEYAPLPAHGSIVDHLYVLKDSGLLTADRRAFASPFTELAFTFRRSADGSAYVPKIVVIQPSFGHRKKNRAFDGWVFGFKGKSSSHWWSTIDRSSVADCQARLVQALRGEPSCTEVLNILDRLLDDLTKQSADRSGDAYQSLNVSQFQVGRLATLLGQSGRTLQRRMRTATGLAPKRFLAVDRFRRAVREIATRQTKLSLVAGGFGFSDQAHLTREFRRHAGLTPKTFQQAWHGVRGQAVRFVQDGASPVRLRVAVWPAKDHR
jgi:AraC-like DNA-binding protein